MRKSKLQECLSIITYSKTQSPWYGTCIKREKNIFICEGSPWLLAKTAISRSEITIQRCWHRLSTCLETFYTTSEAGTPADGVTSIYWRTRHWFGTTFIVTLALVMGNINENRYRYSISTLAKVSIVSILRYPSKNPHHELHTHKLVTYFNVFQLSDFEFFQNF